jgi:hypothetical protein
MLAYGRRRRLPAMFDSASRGEEIPDGEIARLTSSCRKETFDVTGHVILFDGGIHTGDVGDFEVTLTHYGRRVPGGGCVTFFATVEGLITFTL